MKTKVLIFISLLLMIIGCHKIETYDKVFPFRCFQDTIQIKDTTYYMSFNININDVELYFIRKIKWRYDTSEIHTLNDTYYKEKYTVLINNEDYKYTQLEFKKILIEKNKIPRDTTIFKFTPNMYCSWEMFDKIYNLYKNE